MLKRYLLLFIIFISVFGCKNKVSYEGTLIHKNDLPFVGYTYQFDYTREWSDIFLKTSINDSSFPDGFRYYLIFPKDGKYQDFKNNLGQKVKVRGVEKYYMPQITVYVESLPPDYDGPPLYNYLDTYYLEEVEIEKVY